MIRNQLLVLVIIMSCSYSIGAQMKSLYVNDFKYVVGDTLEENKLLQYAQDSGYTYLILYNLYHIHNNLFEITDSLSALPLSEFISKAKSDYGILSVGGVGETFNSFDNIHDYNLDHIHTPLQRLDVYNIEFEFWNGGSTGPGGYYCTTYLEPNGMSCNTSSAFEFILEDLCRLDSICNTYEWLTSEVYIGSPTEMQCAELAQCIDRVLVHYYRASDVYGDGNSIYNYKSERLPALTDSVESIRVMPIFNGRSGYMGPWLLTHPENQAYDTWWYGLNGYEDDTSSWKSDVTIDGFVWYRYTSMYDVILPLSLDYFKAEKQYGGVELIWSNAPVDGLVSVTLQKSINGQDWLPIYRVDADMQEDLVQMNYFDDLIIHSKNYYRLVFQGIEGIIYSEIIIVDYFELNNQLLIWPNPVTELMTISDGSDRPIYWIKIYNSAGEIINYDNSGNKQLLLFDFENGIYIIKAKIGSHIYSNKFVVIK